MSAPRRVPLAALTLAAVGFALVASLGAIWHRSRGIEWERPRWEATRFERLAGESEPGRARMVVAFHPRCPHCRTSVERLAAEREPGGAKLAVLFVDTPVRPDSNAFPRRGEDEVWWDRGGLWRHRWGHRIYGEVLRFDDRGAYIGTSPPN